MTTQYVLIFCAILIVIKEEKSNSYHEISLLGIVLLFYCLQVLFNNVIESGGSFWECYRRDGPDCPYMYITKQEV